VYKADVALVAGDLTGKAIVPIAARDGRFEAELFGVRRTARGDAELAQLERDIADVGYYSFVAPREEAERLAGDEEERHALLHRLMNERIEAWMRLATERLADSDVPLYLIPGNDDDFAIDPILSSDEFTPVNVDGKVVDMPGGLQLLSYGWSNLTPWHTPREVPEEELFARLDELADQVRDPRWAVFMIHVPPHDSGLDTAPILDENLRPTVSAGDVLRGPVGSTAVRRLIEERQPILSIHGHIHESGGRAEDRHDGLREPWQRGEPRHPARLPRRHRRRRDRAGATCRGLRRKDRALTSSRRPAVSSTLHTRTACRSG
jgi:uncharacterized protein